MPDQPLAQELTLSGIAHHCSRETDRFFRRQEYDASYCFELFRRAFVERSQQAFQLLHDQYQPLVAGWVERHSSFHATGEDVAYFVNRAFEKIWAALTPDKFSKFPNLKSLLRYLKTCVHSVIVDFVRTQHRRLVDDEPRPDLGDAPPGNSRVEDEVIEQLGQVAFWQQIHKRLNSPQEQAVIYGGFVLALPPRELYARYRDLFDSVNEIYRVKQNVLDRLRRDREWQQEVLRIT